MELIILLHKIANIITWEIILILPIVIIIILFSFRVENEQLSEDYKRRMENYSDLQKKSKYDSVYSTSASFFI